MPKAKKRKNKEFNNTPVKSVFLYGVPNKEKCEHLKTAQITYVKLVNKCIVKLMNTDKLYMYLCTNNKKSSEMRSFEKEHRPEGINSAFCQNAFDDAVVKLSQYFNNIRLEMLKENQSVLLLSKELYGMTLDHKSKAEMITTMSKLSKGEDFYHDCIAALADISDDDFTTTCADIRALFDITAPEFKIPEVRKSSVPMDSRLMKIEHSGSTVFPYVVTLSDPLCKGKRIAVPLNTSRHSLHKITANKMAATITFSVQGRKLRVGWSYQKKMVQPPAKQFNGVDTGIRDSFHVSDGRAVGTMNNVLSYYHQTVEPSFAGLSDLRNKKRKISYYLRKHPSLPDDVRRSLIMKMDRLEQMIRMADTPYRKKRHYYAMLDKEIKDDIQTYMNSLSHETVTVLERLDIKEFHKSRKLNGKMSTFARGKLQLKLMSELNWKGYAFTEVEPDYTSQVCPVCSNLDVHNRSETDSKVFICTCCGYSDDADHVGSLNIKARAEDKEILALSDKYKYQHAQFQKQLKRLYDNRHIAWLTSNVTPILQESTQPCAVV